MIYIYRGLKPTHSTHQPEVDYCNKYSNFYSGQTVAMQRFLSYYDPFFQLTISHTTDSATMITAHLACYSFL
jgi:hypothetical protein